MFESYGRAIGICTIAISVILANGTTAFATCVANQVPTPASGFFDLFFSIGGAAPSDVWAVGGNRSVRYNIFHTMTEHWDGNTWTVVPSPNVDLRDYSNALNGVAALSSTDVWAVGGLDPRRGGLASQTLSLHWRGQRWSVVSTPSDPGRFNAVAPVKQNGDIWAVGTTDVFPAPGQPLIELWNGSAWSVVASTTFPNGGFIFGVSAPSPHSAWAVGQGYDASANYFPFTLHWNGTAWTQVPAQLVGNDAVFEAVTALSDRNAWAGGYYYDATTNRFLGVIEHWDGTAWHIVPIPNPPTGDMSIMGISALSNTNIWASGYTTPGEEGMLMHWDGTQWTIVPTPHPTGADELFSVAAFPHNVWSAGATFSSGATATFAVLAHC